MEKKRRFSPQNGSEEAPAPLPAHTYNDQEKPIKVREDMQWPNIVKAAPKWLKPYLKVPRDAAPPLAMTPPHPDATGTYGPRAIKWVKKELGIELRWWQKLAFVMQLQHDENGTLLIRTTLESGPRRVGKSVRLRSMALWRLDNEALFGEKQLALHTGKDVAIVREIHRQAWRWAQERDDWDVRKGVGQEEVSTGDNRWLVRSTDSVYGYDVCLGMVDEAWAVDPQTYEEGLEPATMERSSPQLLLTSTAHRKATSLMRKKISAALATDDGETLLLLWAAPSDADPSDPETWKKASPHWSEDRRKMIAAKYESAMSGQADAEADDPDPFEGFLAQYLNRWKLNAKASQKGEGITTPAAWDALTVEMPDEVPDAIAIESGFSEGVSVAAAWKGENNVATVVVIDCPDVATASELIEETEYKGIVLVGKSMANDPALSNMRLKPMMGQLIAVTQELDRYLADGVVRHDGTDPLRTQVLAIRTTPGADGPRMASRSRADAVKAAVWAIGAARSKKTVGKPRILLPTA